MITTDSRLSKERVPNSHVKVYSEPTVRRKNPKFQRIMDFQLPCIKMFKRNFVDVPGDIASIKGKTIMKSFISVISENITHYNGKNLKFVNVNHKNIQRNIWGANNFNPIQGWFPPNSEKK
jgi:hypothetical protein